MRCLFLLSIFLVGCSAKSQIREELKLTFISNEGFLIESGDQKVLIDALYEESHPDFTFPTDGLLTQMTNGAGQFQDVQVYLQSHVHYTHFRPERVGAFLQRNDKAQMIATPQIADSLRKIFSPFADIQEQIIEYNLSENISELQLNGVNITAFKIPHSNPAQWSWVQNLGHIIELGEYKVLHVGDPDWEGDILRSLNLPDRNITVAILPYWLLFQPQALAEMKTVIGAEHYLISHFPIPNLTQNIQQVKTRFPGAIILNEPLASMTF